MKDERKIASLLSSDELPDEAYLPILFINSMLSIFVFHGYQGTPKVNRALFKQFAHHVGLLPTCIYHIYKGTIGYFFFIDIFFVIVNLFLGKILWHSFQLLMISKFGKPQVGWLELSIGNRNFYFGVDITEEKRAVMNTLIYPIAGITDCYYTGLGVHFLFSALCSCD